MQLRTCGSLTVAQGTTRLSSPGPVLASCVLRSCIGIVVRASGTVIKNHHVGRLFFPPLSPISPAGMGWTARDERQWFAMLWT